MSGAQLRNEITDLLIKGGGLKSSVKTRWCSAWDCCDSILRLEPVLRNVSMFYLINLLTIINYIWILFLVIFILFYLFYF